MTADPTRVAGDPHLGIIRSVPPPARRACVECMRLGTPWVHLRQCLTCGHAGTTGHVVVRSLEPGESWRWCYVDEQFV